MESVRGDEIDVEKLEDSVEQGDRVFDLDGEKLFSIALISFFLKNINIIINEYY